MRGASFLKEFKKVKRACWALKILLSLFVLSLCADFITNDKPLMISYQGQYYFPVLKKYSEKTFGGTFETEADYRDPYLLEKIEEKGALYWPLFKFRYDSVNYALKGSSPAPPSKENIFGTDDQGRDVFARLLYGLRVTLLFSLLLTSLSALLGILIGGLQGYQGGKTDLYLQRFLEVWSSMPMLYTLIILTSLIQPSFLMFLGLMLLFKWTHLVGVVRAEVLKVRKYDFVNAARVVGVPPYRIFLKHILPNALSSSLAYLPFLLNASIATLVAMDFLGLGLPASMPSLGEILKQGKNNLNAPWLGIGGVCTLSLVLVLITFIGEGVRYALTPQEKRYD